jgi:hypothetical protein
LAGKTKRLKEEIERETGMPIQLTAAEKKILAAKSKGIDLEVLKEISVFDSGNQSSPTDSIEDR